MRAVRSFTAIQTVKLPSCAKRSHAPVAHVDGNRAHREPARFLGSSLSVCRRELLAPDRSSTVGCPCGTPQRLHRSRLRPSGGQSATEGSPSGRAPRFEYDQRVRSLCPQHVRVGTGRSLTATQSGAPVVADQSGQEFHSDPNGETPKRLQSSRHAPVAQWIRAPDCGSGGQRFESSRAYSEVRCPCTGHPLRSASAAELPSARQSHDRRRQPNSQAARHPSAPSSQAYRREGGGTATPLRVCAFGRRLEPRSLQPHTSADSQAARPSTSRAARRTAEEGCSFGGIPLPFRRKGPEFSRGHRPYSRPLTWRQGVYPFAHRRLACTSEVCPPGARSGLGGQLCLAIMTPGGWAR